MGFSTGVAKLILVALIAVGGVGTWKFAMDNGTIDTINKAAKAPNPVLLDSSEPMREGWTGIGPLDEQLRVLLGFFWPIFEGNLPTLGFLSLQFYGQLIAIWMLLLVESFRVANAWRLVSLLAPSKPQVRRQCS